MTSYKVPVVLRSTEGIARSESDEAIPRIELFTWDCGACPELAEWVAFAPRNDNIHSVVTLTITTTNHYLLPNTGVYPMTSSKTKLTRTFILLLVAIFATATFAILPTTLTAHSAPPPPFERTVDAVPIDFGSGVFHFDVDGHEHLAVTANEIYTVSRQNQVIRYTYNAERQIDSAHSLPSTAATESITASPYGVYHLTRGGVITHIDVVSNNSNTIPVTVAPTAHITHIEAGHGTLFYVTESPHQIFNINSSTPILTSNYRISAIAPTLGPAPYYITRDTVEQVYLIHTPSGIPIERHYFYVAHHDDVLRMLFSNGNLYILSRTHLHIIRTAGTTRRVANIPLGADNLLIIDDIAVQDNNLYVLRRTLGNIRATVFRLELDSNGFPYMHGNSTLNLDVMTQLIGLSGTVLGMFNAPSSVDVGASKTIVSDTNNNRVFVAGDDGERNFVYIGGSTDSVSVAHTNRWHTPTHAAINRSGYMAISDDEGVHILRPSPNYGRITLREITGVRSLMFEGDNLYILHGTGSISRVAGPDFNTPLVTPPTIGAVRAIGTHRIYNGVVYLLYNGDFVSLETGQVVGRTTVPTSNIAGFDIDDRGVFWILDNTRIFSEEPLDANGDPILDDFVQHIYTFSSSYTPLRASNIRLVTSDVTAFGIYIGNFVISDTLGHAIRQVDMSWLVDPDAQNGPRRYSPSDFPRPETPHQFHLNDSYEIIRHTLYAGVPMFDYPIDIAPSLRLGDVGTEVVVIDWQPFPDKSYASAYAFVAVIDEDGNRVFEGYVRHRQISDPPEEYTIPASNRVIADRNNASINIYHYPLSHSPVIQIDGTPAQLAYDDYLTALSFVYMFEDSLGIRWLRVTGFCEDERVGFVRFDDVRFDITEAPTPRHNARIIAPLDEYPTGVRAYRRCPETDDLIVFEGIMLIHRTDVQVVGLFDPTSEFTNIIVYIESLGIPVEIYVRTQYVEYRGAFNAMHAVAVVTGVATIALCTTLVAIKFKKKRI